MGRIERGGSRALPELEIQYADYAVWQREWLQGEVLEEQLRYWREELEERQCWSCRRTGRGRRCRASAEQRWVCVWAGVDGEDARAESSGGVTLFMALLAGFQVVLGRCGGQEDVVVGTEVANRRRRGGGGADRIFCEPAGTADAGGREPECAGVAGASARDAAGSVRAPGCAVREGGGGTAPGAESEPQSAVPGDVGVAELRREELGAAWVDVGAGAWRGPTSMRSSISR